MPVPCDEATVVSSVKLISAIGGFLGGASLLVFVKPTSMNDGIVRILVSTAAAVMLAPVAAVKIFDASADSDSQILMGCGFGVGFVAWNVLGAIAQFFAARQGKDIVQMAKDAANINPSGE